MNSLDAVQSVRIAILAMAEIKAATDAFERGEVNVHEALDAIAVAVEARREAAAEQRRRQERKWAI